jgi:hypothetical protein
VANCTCLNKWNDGLRSFVEYVTNVHMLLVRAEEERRERPSGLRMFARYDVGVFKLGEAHQWYVNEVERCQNTGIFFNDSRALCMKMLRGVADMMGAWALLRNKGLDRVLINEEWVD